MGLNTNIKSLRVSDKACAEAVQAERDICIKIAKVYAERTPVNVRGHITALVAALEKQ